MRSPWRAPWAVALRWLLLAAWPLVVWRVLMPPIRVPDPDPDRDLLVWCPGGRFFAPAGGDGTGPGGFFIDRFEVTAGDFAAYLASNPDASPPESWSDRGPSVGAADRDLPVVGVTLSQARAYAAWRGKRLPSSEEWAWAARGPVLYDYPWGDAVSPLAANTLELGLWQSTPVGVFFSGRSRFGVYDLVGNVREWTETRSGAELQDRHVVRGGSFTTPQHECMGTQDLLGPRGWSFDLGFRCVVSAERRRHQVAIVEHIRGLGGRDPSSWLFSTLPNTRWLRRQGGPDARVFLESTLERTSDDRLRSRLRSLLDELPRSP